MLPSKLRRRKKAIATVIRSAKKSDEEAIGRMWFDLLTMQGELDGRFAPSEDARTRWKNDFPAWLDRLSRRIFVAEVGGEICGFISAEQWAPPPIFDDKPGVYVSELYVREAERRQGVGTQLIGAVKEWANEIGAHQIRAGVLVRNNEGAEFWRTVGGEGVSQTFAISMDVESPDAQKKQSLGFKL